MLAALLEVPPVDLSVPDEAKKLDMTVREPLDGHLYIWIMMNRSGKG